MDVNWSSATYPFIRLLGTCSNHVTFTSTVTSQQKLSTFREKTRIFVSLLLLLLCCPCIQQAAASISLKYQRGGFGHAQQDCDRAQNVNMSQQGAGWIQTEATTA